MVTPDQYGNVAVMVVVLPLVTSRGTTGAALYGLALAGATAAYDRRVARPR